MGVTYVKLGLVLHSIQQYLCITLHQQLQQLIFPSFFSLFSHAFPSPCSYYLATVYLPAVPLACFRTLSPAFRTSSNHCCTIRLSSRSIRSLSSLPSRMHRAVSSPS